MHAGFSQGNYQRINRRRTKDEYLQAAIEPKHYESQLDTVWAFAREAVDTEKYTTVPKGIPKQPRCQVKDKISESIWLWKISAYPKQCCHGYPPYHHANECHRYDTFGNTIRLFLRSRPVSGGDWCYRSWRGCLDCRRASPRL